MWIYTAGHRNADIYGRMQFIRMNALTTLIFEFIAAHPV